MHVCILANARAVHTQRWATAYAERDHRVSVLGIRDEEIPGVTVESVAGPAATATTARTFVSYGRLLLQCRRRLDALAPDVLHAQYTVTHGAIAAASRFHPRVVSAWGRDVIWDGRGRMPLPLRALNRYALARADEVTATSSFLADHVRRFLPAGAGLEIVPFGVDVDRFRPAAAERAAPDDGSFTLGFVKTLRRKYGPAVLLRAMPAILRQVPGARLVMAGRGPLEDELRRLAAELGIASRVEMPGFVPHHRVPDLLRRLDVFVNCSIYPSESFGVAVLEASACGLPVVVTRVGGIPEVCDDGETGLMVEPGDPEALAAAVVRLAADRDRRRAMGERGRRLVVGRYVWSDNVDAMLEILDRAVARHRAGAAEAAS